MSLWKLNKKVLFGISGGIAAYKTPDIIHGLVKAGCEVETIMTESAEQFVSPLVISTIKTGGKYPILLSQIGLIALQ